MCPFELGWRCPQGCAGDAVACCLSPLTKTGITNEGAGLGADAMLSLE